MDRPLCARDGGSVILMIASSSKGLSFRRYTDTDDDNDTDTDDDYDYDDCAVTIDLTSLFTHIHTQTNSDRFFFCHPMHPSVFQTRRESSAACGSVEKGN